MKPWPCKGLLPVVWYWMSFVTFGVITIPVVLGYLVVGSKAFEPGPPPSPGERVLSLLILFGVPILMYVMRVMGAYARIEVSHIGILVTLGERSNKYLLTEGIYWIPPFSRVISFDSRERQLEIPPGEVLSSDNIPIRFKTQLQLRVVDPYLYSSVVDPEKTLVTQAVEAARILISQHTALEIAALNETLAETMTARLIQRSKDWGIEVISSSFSELRLPEEIEKYAQVIRIIRNQHPEMSPQRILDALQADKGTIRKQVLESTSLESAATALFRAISR